MAPPTPCLAIRSTLHVSLYIEKLRSIVLFIIRVIQKSKFFI